MKKEKWRKQPHPASIAVRTWMLQQNLLGADVVRDMEIDHSYVTHFINGRRLSKRLRAYFRDKGCPPLVLADLEGPYQSKKVARKGCP